MTVPATSTRQTALLWLALGALAICSLGLGLTRIYQVDEAQNLYMARVLARGEAHEFFTSAALHLVPLGWLTMGLEGSADVFTAARVVFVALFWANIVLVSIAAGARFGSASGAWIALGAATLAPMWDYGFEIRHENVLLCGLLVMWIVGRADPDRAWRMIAVGGLTALLHFVAIKAMLYTVPMAGLLVALPGTRESDSRLRRAAFWAAGVLATAVAVCAGYTLADAWDTYTAVFAAVARGSRDLATSEPLKITSAATTLLRLPQQSSLLLAALLGGLIVTLSTLYDRLVHRDVWSGGHAETLLFLVALTAFFANPTPFPYNLLLLVPFAYVLAVRALASQASSAIPGRSWWPWIAGLVVFTHAFPFAYQSHRHLAWDNARQIEVMAAAEALTDRDHDRVFDATGLVVSRRSIGRWWYLHSLSVKAYGTKDSPRVAEMLSRRPAAVLIMSYRTDWLPEPDKRFIGAHYFPLSDDFWVLGVLITGEQRWQCLHGGRYELRVWADRGNPPPAVMVNGKLLLPGVHRLDPAQYDLRITAGGRAALVWVGPRLETPPALAQFDHSRLFVNWY